MVSVEELTTEAKPSWCPGCGDYFILSAIKRAISELDLDPNETVIVTGIGCGSKINHFIKTYGFEGLHGRALPVATGVKLANTKLNVIVVAGDGDAYGIGGNHFLHTCRRNINITYITQDNSVYGLTKGQTSPTSAKGFKTSSTPFGVIEEPVNPLTIGIVSGATFLARAYSYDVDQMTEMIKIAIQHKGFSLVNVLQVCQTFNKVNTPDWYKENTYYMEGHDTSDKEAALQKAADYNKLALGIFYKEDKPTYDEQEPQIESEPLVEQTTEVDISGLLDKFR